VQVGVEARIGVGKLFRAGFEVMLERCLPQKDQNVREADPDPGENRKDEEGKGGRFHRDLYVGFASGGFNSSASGRSFRLRRPNTIRNFLVVP
jgi:hypothetical protein